MEGDGGHLGEFSNMINLIRANNGGTFDHGKVPSELTSATPAPQSPVKRMQQQEQKCSIPNDHQRRISQEQTELLNSSSTK